MKEKDIPLVYVASISAILAYLNLYTIYSLLVYKDILKDVLPNKYYVLVILALIWLLNYIGFVRKKRFLDYNFRADVKGGILVILYLIVTALSFIIVANYNREKIFNQDKKNSWTEQVKQNASFEGKTKVKDRI